MFDTLNFEQESICIVNELVLEESIRTVNGLVEQESICIVNELILDQSIRTLNNLAQRDTICIVNELVFEKSSCIVNKILPKVLINKPIAKDMITNELETEEVAVLVSHLNKPKYFNSLQTVMNHKKSQINKRQLKSRIKSQDATLTNGMCYSCIGVLKKHLKKLDRSKT